MLGWTARARPGTIFSGLLPDMPVFRELWLPSVDVVCLNQGCVSRATVECIVCVCVSRKVPEHRWGKRAIERAVAVCAMSPPRAAATVCVCVWGVFLHSRSGQRVQGVFGEPAPAGWRERARFFDLAGSDPGLLQKWRERVSCAGGATSGWGDGADSQAKQVPWRGGASPLCLQRVFHSGILFAPFSFQKKVEKFHEGQVVSSLSPESYVGRTIMLVNCCPPFR